MCLITCDVCGRFIALSDFGNGKATMEFTPDSALTLERTDFAHTACLEPKEPKP